MRFSKHNFDDNDVSTRMASDHFDCCLEIVKALFTCSSILTFNFSLLTQKLLVCRFTEFPGRHFNEIAFELSTNQAMNSAFEMHPPFKIVLKR